MIFLQYNMTKIELNNAMPRKLALSVTLTLHPTGMGIIVQVQSILGERSCIRVAEKSRATLFVEIITSIQELTAALTCSAQNSYLIYVVSIYMYKRIITACDVKKVQLS